MSGTFDRSLRTIESSRPRRALSVFVLTVIVLGGWLVWFAAGRVAVYAPSVSARLEVANENHPVDAIVGGRVVAIHAAVGQRVQPGDLLLELDANPERLARDEERSRLAPALAQVGSLREELEAEQRGLEGELLAAKAAAQQNTAQKQKAEDAARYAKKEEGRVAELQAKQLISANEAERLENVASQLQSEAESAAHNGERILREFDTRTEDRRARIARLKRDIAEIEGTQALAQAATNRLGYDMEQRVIRASVAGTIVDVTPLTVGSVIASGRRICTIVPNGDLKVVAQFAPSVALGRVRQGQIGRLRLDGFPWTQYGTPTAHVTTVAGEPSNNGTIRVELALESNEAARMIPLQHGLPAEVDVEVERTSPALLVLRTIGAYTRLSAAER